jgi:uncharacterized protein
VITHRTDGAVPPRASPLRSADRTDGLRVMPDDGANIEVCKIAASTPKQPIWRCGPICITRVAPLNHGIEIFLERRFMAAGRVRDNKALSRFELDVEGALAFANYRLTPSTVIITHTETPLSLRGRGIASELVQGALQLIRADGLKVIAGCSFVLDYLHKHPEIADLAG